MHILWPPASTFIAVLTPTFSKASFFELNILINLLRIVRFQYKQETQFDRYNEYSKKSLM